MGPSFFSLRWMCYTCISSKSSGLNSWQKKTGIGCCKIAAICKSLFGVLDASNDIFLFVADTISYLGLDLYFMISDDHLSQKTCIMYVFFPDLEIITLVSPYNQLKMHLFFKNMLIFHCHVALKVGASPIPCPKGKSPQ